MADDPSPEIPDLDMSGLDALFALRAYGVQATGSTSILADYVESGTVSWAATDLGLIDCLVREDLIVFNLTLWKDVSDVELRAEVATFESGAFHTDYSLTVQHPRLDARGSGNVREFVHTVVRMAAAQPMRTL